MRIVLENTPRWVVSTRTSSAPSNQFSGRAGLPSGSRNSNDSRLTRSMERIPDQGWGVASVAGKKKFRFPMSASRREGWTSR